MKGQIHVSVVLVMVEHGTVKWHGGSRSRCSPSARRADGIPEGMFFPTPVAPADLESTCTCTTLSSLETCRRDF
jgi:hypothetical protein